MHATPSNGGISEGGVIESTRNESHDARCPSARHLAMVREETWACNEGATGVWTAANEAVDSARACRLM
ncbi:hypothetical protein TNCV_2218751 [Trichonephila clavipes]|nr:hypothetical protein TNCV_2218751 [Trichonephila clavipes]